MKFIISVYHGRIRYNLHDALVITTQLGKSSEIFFSFD